MRTPVQDVRFFLAGAPILRWLRVCRESDSVLSIIRQRAVSGLFLSFVQTVDNEPVRSCGLKAAGSFSDMAAAWLWAQTPHRAACRGSDCLPDR